MKRTLLLFVLFAFAGSIAHAETLLFTLSGVTNGSFELDSNPAPNDSVSGSYTKFINLTFTDGATTLTNYQIIFFSTSNGGSFSDISSPTFFDAGFYGDQIYSGSESAPVFAPGVFAGTDLPGGPTTETLTISALPTPEPSSLIFTLTGLASTAFVGARRKWALRA